MSAGDIMTMKQAKEKMEYYREIFDVVRLIDEESLSESETEWKCDTADTDKCYHIWGKNKRCKNCISRKAFCEKGQKTKLEFRDTSIYYVIAKYVEIDGKPYVLELEEKMDESSLLDADGYKKLSGKISGYADKLYTDVLTGVYNRRYFEEEIKKKVKCAGIAMIDLDDFKLYNDTYGHNAGDMALITVTNQIRQCVDGKGILIRYGGDEFLLVMPDVPEDEFEEYLRIAGEKIHQAGVPGYAGMGLSVSIGGVMTRNQPFEDALRRADKLMYQAKNHKNMVVTEKDLLENGAESGQKEMNQQILVIDDSEINRDLLTEILQDDFRILEAENGEEGLQIIRQQGKGISLILLDIIMPVMDGFDLLIEMNREHWLEDIPVIMISSEYSESYIRRAYELGASDYISRPFDAKIVYQRVYNMIKLYARQHRLAELVASQLYEREKNSRMMVEMLSQIIEFRTGDSDCHTRNISIFTGLMIDSLLQKTDRYSFSLMERELIVTASALHDIGKIGIDECILNKPGKLTKEEFDIIKTHTMTGADILERMMPYQDEALIKTAYEICRWHHERYDGNGYPDGISGEEIPISAQIVSLADVYVALTSDRVYQTKVSHERAVEMIRNRECGVFNPLLLECFADIEKKIKESLTF